MKVDCGRCEVKDCLSKCMLKTRNEMNLSQMAFAEKLHIDRRSYLDLEHGKSLCCSMTLLIFLAYYCKDSKKLLEECKEIFDKYGYGQNTEKQIWRC